MHSIPIAFHSFIVESHNTHRRRSSGPLRVITSPKSPPTNTKNDIKDVSEVVRVPISPTGGTSGTETRRRPRGMSLALNTNTNEAYSNGMKEYEDEIAASSAAVGLGLSRRNSTSPVNAMDDGRSLDSAIALPNEENERRMKVILSKPVSSARRRRTSDRATTSGSPRHNRACTTRRVVIGFLIFLSLFLIGTVIVLSTISYYLAIPDWAYLTEAEVPFSMNDAIREFQKETANPGEEMRRLRRREEWEEVLDDGGDVDILEVGHEIFGDEIGDTKETQGEERPDNEELLEEDIASEWSPEGKGSGAYYMRSDWDGTVLNMTNWDRLEEVKTL